MAQPVETGAELLIEHGELAVEHDRLWPEPTDRCGDVRVADCMIDAGPAHETDLAAVIIGASIR